MNISASFLYFISKVVLLILLRTDCFGFAKPILAQVAESSELFKTLAKKDSLLFDEGFNHCNIEVTEDIISKDLEFYHDTGGIQDREEFFKAIKENICSSPDRKPIRKLVLGTLNVSPSLKKTEIYMAQFKKAFINFILKSLVRIYT
ncbi:MAG: nuclear transport factor 2 family protein [Balneolaceae bacterium]|nr:nuclear transport factor 2 family protein [Balneolaceae bacterium]